jgi:hypothetical protein
MEPGGIFVYLDSFVLYQLYIHESFGTDSNTRLIRLFVY